MYLIRIIIKVRLMTMQSLTIELPSIISLSACVCLVVEATQSAIVLPVVRVQANIQLST